MHKLIAGRLRVFPNSFNISFKVKGNGYATSAGSDEFIDYHKKHELATWPKSKSPTPHEIFNIIDTNDQDLYKKQLKSMYQKYIKIYHPDISNNLTILNHENKPLSGEEKRARFDKIQEAYDVLKNPSRRQAYSTYSKTSWDDYDYKKSKRTANDFNTYRMANAHRRKYDFKNDEAFWKAGTWEDYYHMRYNRTPPTQEELDKNKYKILIGVLLVASLTTGLQIMLAINKTEEFNRETALMNLNAIQNIESSYNNYEEGTSRLQRLRRFLLFRRSAMIDKETEYLANGNEEEAKRLRKKIHDDDVAKIMQNHKIEDMKIEEDKILRKYAQQQVGKFE